MSLKNKIVPIPREFKYLEGNPIILGYPGKSLCAVNLSESARDDLSKNAENLLNERLKDVLNAPLQPGGNVSINLGISAAPEGVKNAEQGYILKAQNNSIDITGFGPEGLYYGVVSFLKLLKMENSVLKLPCFEILDWPDMRTRGHFMESRYGSNLMTLDDWKAVVDHMASMKMNQLVVSVYGCWCVQYDNRVSEYLYIPVEQYPKLKTPVVKKYYSPEKKGWVNEEQLPPMFEEDFFGDLVAYGKTKAVTVFPLVNSYGHNTLIPAQYPETSAIDEAGNPSLTGFCTASPKTYELLFTIYDNLIDKYLKPNGVDSFHVGLDEVWDGLAHNAEDIFRKRSPWCKCSVCSGKTKKELFIDHAIKILKYLKSRGMKNIYMYHDMLIGHGDKETVGGTVDMVKALKDNDLMDEVILDWWTYSDFEERLMFNSTQPELGFRRTVKPWNGYYHWNVMSHPLKNIYLLGKMGYEEDCEGMQSYSAWDRSYDRNHEAQADYSWNFKGSEGIGDVTRRYVARYFPTKQDEALRAFKLMDLAIESGKDGAVLSNYNVLMGTLSYYFYSYVREGKPYPRIFPGEAIKIIDENRENYMRQIYQIASMSGEAVKLFKEMSWDPCCNQEMATRYLYEALNYLCLADDFIALMNMKDIYEGDESDKLDVIKNLAGQRKVARLSLMSYLEQVKEEFLLASHMRNQSIFMQFFADLEGYIANNPDGKLDFYDMRYLESDAFKSLR